jgi:galactokinase
MVDLAAAHPEVYGARLTGGGFGGSIVALARRGEGMTAGTQIAAQYEARTGHVPQLLVAGGAGCSRS